MVQAYAWPPGTPWIQSLGSGNLNAFITSAAAGALPNWSATIGGSASTDSRLVSLQEQDFVGLLGPHERLTGALLAVLLPCGRPTPG